jgi:hypothetical protein
MLADFASGYGRRPSATAARNGSQSGKGSPAERQYTENQQCVPPHHPGRHQCDIQVPIFRHCTASHMQSATLCCSAPQQTAPDCLKH